MKLISDKEYNKLERNSTSLDTLRLNTQRIIRELKLGYILGDGFSSFAAIVGKIRDKDTAINTLTQSNLELRNTINHLQSELKDVQASNKQVEVKDKLKELYIYAPNIDMDYNDISEVLVWTDKYKKFIANEVVVELHNESIESNYELLNLGVNSEKVN